MSINSATYQGSIYKYDTGVFLTTYYLKIDNIETQPILYFKGLGGGGEVGKISAEDYKEVQDRLQTINSIGTFTISDEKARVIVNGKGNFKERDDILGGMFSFIKPEDYDKRGVFALCILLRLDLNLRHQILKTGGSIHIDLT